MLFNSQNRQVLNIIASGKGVIACEKINSIDSLSTKSEDGVFFQKMNFTVLIKEKL